MSYLTVTRITTDAPLTLRVVACAATEGIPDPQFWVQEHMWQIAAQPDWDAAYASASLAHEADPDTVPPGENEAAITDQMILAAVQALNTSPAE